MRTFTRLMKATIVRDLLPGLAFGWEERVLAISAEARGRVPALHSHERHLARPALGTDGTFFRASFPDTHTESITFYQHQFDRTEIFGVQWPPSV